MGNSYIENSRLRSLRSKKRKVKEDLEKYVRKQNNLYDKLQDKRRKIPLLPLEKPYQKGFVRFFVLREDVSKTKKADFFQQILEKINTYQYSDNRKFLKKKRKRGKRIYVPREQKLATFSEWELFKGRNRSPVFTEKEMTYFVKRNEYCPWRKSFITCYEFTEPWRFVLRVKPNIITHYKPLDLDLEKQLGEVWRFIDRYEIRGLAQKKIYCSNRYSWKSVLKHTEKEKYRHNNLKNNNLFKLKATATEIAEMFSEQF